MTDTLGDLLKKFWAKEEVPETQTQPDEQTVSEDLYREITYLRNDGQYITPLLARVSQLDSIRYSRPAVQQQYLSIDRNLEKKNSKETSQKS